MSEYKRVGWVLVSRISGTTFWSSAQPSKPAAKARFIATQGYAPRGFDYIPVYIRRESKEKSK